MDFDYKKVVKYLLDIDSNTVANALKSIITKDFILMDLSDKNKVVSIKSVNSNSYYILEAKNSKTLIIYPIEPNFKYLSDDFGYVIEIGLNIDNEIVISSISKYNNGILTSSSTWEYRGNKYKQSVGRILYCVGENIDRLNIETFLIQYERKRTDILNDLYWDVKAYSKDYFIDVKKDVRNALNEEYTNFDDAYRKWNELVEKVKTKV